MAQAVSCHISPGHMTKHPFVRRFSSKTVLSHRSDIHIKQLSHTLYQLVVTGFFKSMTWVRYGPWFFLGNAWEPGLGLITSQQMTTEHVFGRHCVSLVIAVKCGADPLTHTVLDLNLGQANADLQSDNVIYCIIRLGLARGFYRCSQYSSYTGCHIALLCQLLWHKTRPCTYPSRHIKTLSDLKTNLTKILCRTFLVEIRTVYLIPFLLPTI